MNMVIIFKFAFILLALSNTSTLAREVSKINGNKLMAAGEKVVSYQKELVSVATTNMMLGGRKMLVEKTLEKENEVKEEKAASNISGGHAGNDAYERTTTLNGHSIDQGPNFHEPASNDESQRLLDQAADEIVNLMRKDYFKGAVKPRHKPPINNHEPRD